MKNLGILMGVAGGTVSLFFGGCGDLPGERIALPTELGGIPNIPGAGFPQGQGVGDSCADDDCRAGLICNDDDECEPGGTLGAEQPCTIGPECAEGLHCQFAPPLNFSVCVDAGDGEVGDGCQTDLDCEGGLRCGLNGFELQCVEPGEGDVGDACLAHQNCHQGLYCVYEEGSPAGACSYPEQPLGIPLWGGVECQEQDDNNVEAMFYVPGADDTPDNSTFFDFPYPNDARLDSDGRPDLDGFPTPGAALLGVDMVAAYVDAVENHTNGWSTNPVIYFRFSGAIDIDSLVTPEGGQRRVFISDVDALPDDPEDGFQTFSTQYSIGSGSNYICDDWFALRLPRNTLTPGHRYVAWITTDARSREGGDPVGRPEQFAAMLEDSAPSDGALSDAWDAYAPMREYLSFYEGSSNEIDPDSLLIGTVFTTHDPIQPMRDLADGVAAADMPTTSDWVKCADGVSSPCAQADDAEGRACGSGTDDYDEYQAHIRLPIFQRGDAPYLLEGGDLADEAERYEEVCLSMSIPKAAAPGAGWPLVIYGHGTGGSYRGPIRDSVAGVLARSTPAFATLGYDAVQHGPRRGEGEDANNDPENLFFNFVNPDAARGNPLQGAADVLSIVRWAEQGAVATAADTGDAEITVDATKIFYFGHSQGSTHGSIAIPFSDIPGTVLSGNGGGLAEALMNKTNPVDIAGAIPFAIQDADAEGNLRLGEKHPVLNLLQHYIDPADPINYGALMTVRPEAGQTVKHVFQTFGLDDTYSPPTTLAAYIYAAELALAAAPNGVDPEDDNVLGLTSADSVTDNVTLDTTTVTAVARQYNPANGSDGHFVVHDVQEANDDAIGFLESLANGTPPVVPAP